MQPPTIRRLLVFGVCLAGVGCLYLVPSLADSRHGESAPARHDLPTASPAAGPAAGTPATATDAASTSPTKATRTTRATAMTSAATRGEAGPTTQLRQDSAPATRPAATAVAPGTDDEPPGPVGRLRVVESDPQRFTVSWSTATDGGGGVVTYQVRLNGFVVLVTQQTQATLAWFNDSDTHVIQVRALDAAGNEGLSSPTLIVSRPSPSQKPSAATPSPSQPSATEQTSISERTGSATPDATPVPNERIAETDRTNSAASPPPGSDGAEEDGS